MRVKLDEVCKRIYAGGDVPKDKYSEQKTDQFTIPIYANAEKNDGLYGYTDKARETELCITVAARGTIGYTSIRKEPFLPVVRLIVVVPDTTVISVNYLYYILKGLKPQSTGTSIPQLTVPDIKKRSIELYTLPEQETIAKKLSTIERLIEELKKELVLFDELVKARFVEMFGDVISNSKSWKTKPWNCVLCIKNGRNQKAVENPNGVFPICGSGGVIGYADDYITNENSVIIGRKGNINKPILMREKYWNVDTAFGLEPNSDLLNVECLFLFCEFFDFEVLNKAVTIPSLTKADLLKIEIPLPPIKFQNEFAEFVQEVDKSKVVVQKALDEAQLLFDSLMQQYFG